MYARGLKLTLARQPQRVRATPPCYLALLPRGLIRPSMFWFGLERYLIENEEVYCLALDSMQFRDTAIKSILQYS